MQIGPYRIVRELGRGAMGAVFHARDAGGREVALKLLTGSLDANRRERFAREGQLAARLQHPGIVQVHAAGEHQGRPWLAYELVRSPPRAHGALPLRGRLAARAGGAAPASAPPPEPAPAGAPREPRARRPARARARPPAPDAGRRRAGRRATSGPLEPRLRAGALAAGRRRSGGALGLVALAALGALALGGSEGAQQQPPPSPSVAADPAPAAASPTPAKPAPLPRLLHLRARREVATRADAPRAERLAALERALATVERGLELQPDEWRLLVLRAQFLEKRGEWTGAKQDLERALASVTLAKALLDGEARPSEARLRAALGR